MAGYPTCGYRYANPTAVCEERATRRYNEVTGDRWGQQYACEEHRGEARARWPEPDWVETRPGEPQPAEWGKIDAAVPIDVNPFDLSDADADELDGGPEAWRR